MIKRAIRLSLQVAVVKYRLANKKTGDTWLQLEMVPMSANGTPEQAVAAYNKLFPEEARRGITAIWADIMDTSVRTYKIPSSVFLSEMQEYCIQEVKNLDDVSRETI